MVFAFRCPRTMGGCSIICSLDGDFDGTPDLCVPRAQASSVLEHMLTVAGMERASIEKRPIKGGRWAIDFYKCFRTRLNQALRIAHAD